MDTPWALGLVPSRSIAPCPGRNSASFCGFGRLPLLSLCAVSVSILTTPGRMPGGVGDRIETRTLHSAVISNVIIKYQGILFGKWWGRGEERRERVGRVRLCPFVASIAISTTTRRFQLVSLCSSNNSFSVLHLYLTWRRLWKVKLLWRKCVSIQTNVVIRPPNR